MFKHVVSKFLFVSLIGSQLFFVPNLRADDEAESEDEISESKGEPRPYGVIDNWILPGGLGAIALHATACAGHCSPGTVPLVTYVKEHPVNGCAIYLLAAGVGVISRRLWLSRQTR